jgi:hypothetical protein
LTMKKNRMFSACFEHWKPGCMVSCKTVQGRNKCARRQAKPRRTELARRCLEPRVFQ